MNDSFSIQFRLTKKCNADCSYCSSNAKAKNDCMTFEDFKQSVDFILERYLPNFISVPDSYITANYLGGEILTIKESTLNKCVLYARERFSSNCLEYRDGVQTNLISSPLRAARLHELFEGRVGTSVDNITNQRTIGGSSERYKKTMSQVIAVGLEEKHPPAVLVVDKHNVNHLLEEYEIAKAKNYNLTVRPIFIGGKNESDKPHESTSDKMVELFHHWFMKDDENLRLEPFYSMVTNKINQKYPAMQSCEGCAFQNNCTNNSLNLDPEGDLYLCNEMADKEIYPLGNAVEGMINESNLAALRQREFILPIECLSCAHFSACKGGCMQNAYDHTGDILGHDPFCDMYTQIFNKIEKFTDNYDNIEKVMKWLKNIS